MRISIAPLPRRRAFAVMLVLPVALGALAVLVPASIAAEPHLAAEPDAVRPRPPTSSELRAATPRARVATQADLGAPTPLPAGSRRVIPDHRVVSLYGAPQMTATILGRLRGYGEAGRMANREAARYRFRTARPVVPAMELVASIATADPGRDGLYRFRQSDATIATYLRAARRADTRLVLDIQPGRSPLVDELEALRPWLREPDVDLAIDPEWNVGPSGVPGRTDGSVDVATVNRLSYELARIVDDHNLPAKVMVVHQFRRQSIDDRSRLRARKLVATTLSFDGIGTPSQKRAGYAALRTSRVFNGIALFYRLDRGLMSPWDTATLAPTPLYVLYQ